MTTSTTLSHPVGKPTKALSLFTGVGGLDLAADRAGMDIVAMSEVNKACQQVLKLHWSAIPLVPDVKDVHDDHGPVDVVFGGSPCQGLSQGYYSKRTGGRLGLEDPRSAHFFEYVRVLEEVQPEWFVWENVPGALRSDQGRDMGAIVGQMADLGYGIAWRVLDARGFGVPQRRRRLIVVGRAGGDVDSAARVLLEPEGVPRPAGADRAQGHSSSRPAAGGADSGVRFRTASGLIPYRKSRKAQNSHTDDELWVNDDYSNTLTCQDSGDIYTASIVVTEDDRARRLTPLEEERLQGFPDGWTEYGANGKPIAETNRRKMMGNAVAVPVGQWVMDRLMMERNAA